VNDAQRKWTEVIAVLLLSLGLVWFVHAGVDNNALAEAVWLFYLPSWFIVLAFFGGVHGAPSWSELPVFVISFTLQNFAVWYASKWFAMRVWRAARET
jgi:hypothetical protein